MQNYEELQKKYERLSQHTVDMKDEIRSTSTVHMTQGLRNKVDELYGLLGDYYTKEQLKVFLDKKVKVSKISSAISFCSQGGIDVARGSVDLSCNTTLEE